MDKLPCWANAKFLCFIMVVMLAASAAIKPPSSTQWRWRFNIFPPRRESEKWLWREKRFPHVGYESKAFGINCQVCLIPSRFNRCLGDSASSLLAFDFAVLKSTLFSLKTDFPSGRAARAVGRTGWEEAKCENMDPERRFFVFIDFSLDSQDRLVHAGALISSRFAYSRRATNDCVNKLSTSNTPELHRQLFISQSSRARAAFHKDEKHFFIIFTFLSSLFASNDFMLCHKLSFFFVFLHSSTAYASELRRALYRIN
jgi:hypothetical protein